MDKRILSVKEFFETNSKTLALECLNDHREGALPMLSTVTGEPVGPEELTAEYWWRGLRDRVRFSEAVSGSVRLGHTTFLEIGPHPVLSGYIADYAGFRIAMKTGSILLVLIVVVLVLKGKELVKQFVTNHERSDSKSGVG